MKPKAIVIGSGAGGAVAAKELQGDFDVTVLEEGGPFKPFSVNLALLEKMRKTGAFFDEREISLLFPNMKAIPSSDSIVMVRGKGFGGTTTLSAGNALRCDEALQAMGFNLDEEFEEIYREVPITYDHRNKWGSITNETFRVSEAMGLEPKLLPKMGNYDRCTKCGQCVLGCKYGVKWDSRSYLHEAQKQGAVVVPRCTVTQIDYEGGHAKGVFAKHGGRSAYYPADVIVLAAGGFSTPTILQNSGIPCESTLFVDPVLCVAANMPNAKQNKEITMPFVVEKEHYIIAPYFDFLSHFFNKEWRIPAKDTVSLMIKLADETVGSVSSRAIEKPLSSLDKERLEEGVELCVSILEELNVAKEDTFLGTLNAGHPGGVFPLTSAETKTMHSERLPGNLYIADGSLLPLALGKPPILTITALAKKVSKVIKAGQ